jgi:predicted nucleic acid-binding protein
MLLVDTSVWVDYFNGVENPHTNFLDEHLGLEPIGVGDLVLAEVLQGFRTDKGYRTARRLFSKILIYEMVGAACAVRAADNHRRLRAKGITVRKTIDTLIATFCIDRDFPLLFTDKDFRPFVAHLGLRAALPAA